MAQGWSLCYWCDSEAKLWIDWVIHEIPGVYGGGCLVSVVGVCRPHAEMIADVDAVVSFDGVFS